METVSSSGGDAVGGFFPVCKEWQALRMHVDSDSDAFFGMLINCRGNPAFLMQKNGMKMTERRLERNSYGERI
jgi:hypothetical protein